jgi:hypothetical protein
LALLFAVPPVSVAIGGFGWLQQIFPINHVRLLSLTILLPTFVMILNRRDRLRLGAIWPDRLLLGYLAVSFGVYLGESTFTNVIRNAVLIPFLDVFLPYYVASRSLQRIEALREALASLVVAALILSGVGIFEMLRGWNLYSGLLGAWEVAWGYGKYLYRGTVALRAQASTGHPIALGFVLAVSLSLAVYVRTLVPRGARRTMAMALLVGGLIAAISRGPWVGALAGLLTYAATIHGARSRIAKYLVVALVCFFVLQTFPIGQEILDLLPFVGTLESGNIDYRRRLISVAFEAIWESPWFGGIDIYSVEGNEALRQSRGFIDVVNTYVGILLGTGIVGLSLFLSLFAATAVAINRAMKRVPESDETHTMGRALLASLAAVLVTIFTVSSITIIGPVYWCLIGIGVAYARVVLSLRLAPTRTAAQTRTGRPHRLGSASVSQ